jgi:hypothetical protein
LTVQPWCFIDFVGHDYNGKTRASPVPPIRRSSTPGIDLRSQSASHSSFAQREQRDLQGRPCQVTSELNKTEQTVQSQPANNPRSLLHRVSSGWTSAISVAAMDSSLIIMSSSGSLARYVLNHYLGLEFQIAGQTHFGWAELSVTGSRFGPNQGLTTVVVGFAYETIAGKSIITGQTGAPNACAPPSTDQQPSNLGLRK